MWKTILRRLGFVVALLGMGPLTVSCFHLSYNTSWAQAQGRTPSLVAFGTFAWGADALGIVLGAWLAARYQIWSTWSGRARALTYVLAFGYGRMLFSATQDWLIQANPSGGRTPPGVTIPFRWPGLDWQDYARPSLDLLSLLTLVWLLVPLFTVIRGQWCEAQERPESRPTFSLLFLLSWTTVSTIILLWIRFLTWKDIAPQTAYSFQTPTQALTEFATHNIPSEVITALVVIVAAWAWSGGWWRPVVGLLAALLIDGLGHNGLYAVLNWATGSTENQGVLSGPLLEQWSFLVGRNTSIWLALGLAALTGVRLRSPWLATKSSGKATEQQTNPATVAT
jgi:hypothetical protein